MTPLRNGAIIVKEKTEARSNAELKSDLVAWLLEAVAPYEVLAELRFHPTRQWRFDYAVPGLMLAVEIQGIVRGAKGKGGHGGIAQMRSDCEKFCAALPLGWSVAPIMYEHIKSGAAYVWLADVIAYRWKVTKGGIKR